MGGLCPLFFDGAVCQFEELPKPDNKSELAKIYNYLNHIRNVQVKLFFNHRIKQYKDNSNNLLNKFIKIFK